MFLGRHDHSIDEKGRLAIPARFRPDLEGGLVVIAALTPCLQVFTPQAFLDRAGSINELNWLNPSAEELQRNLFAMAAQLVPDRLGRILIPPPLRAHAGLEDQVVIVGAFNRLEIWSLASWEEQRQRFSESGSVAVQQFANPVPPGPAH